MMKQLNEHQMTQELLQGDEQTLQKILQTLLPQILAKLQKCNGRKEDAIEIVHDAIMIAINDIASKKYQEGNLIGYIYQIAIRKAQNFCRDKWRKDKRENTKTTDDLSHINLVDEEHKSAVELEEEEDIKLKEKVTLEKCINELTTRDKAIITKYYFEEKKWKELADEFETTSGALRRRAGIIKGMLKNCVEEKLNKTNQKKSWQSII